MSFYWKMIKLKYNFKQWHIFTISEFFKNVNMVQEKVNEVYYTILESNINENGRGRILQSIAIDNIINSMDLEDVCSIKKAVNYLKQDENMIVHIADILIKYEKKFYENVTTYSNDIKTILMKMLANSYSSNLEKNKIILYLCQVCIKWMNRIIKHHSLPGSTPLERKIEVEYEKAYVKLSDTANICLQKELKVISSNINNCTAELLLKYLILFRDMHRINPLYSVENKIMVEANFTDKDTKEKRLFIINVMNIIFNSFLTEEVESRVITGNKEKQEKFKEIMEIIYNAVNHPYVYSLIADTIPKLAQWAKRSPEDTTWFCKLVEKWVVNNIIEVNKIIDEKAQTYGETALHKCLPHLSARIFHALSKDHIDLIDKNLVIRLLWVYRKLMLFLENFFKKPIPIPGAVVNTNIEFKEKYKGIFFPSELEMKYDLTDLHYSQISIVYTLKVAAVKVHEFDINILDDYLKILDNIITYCKNEDLSMIIYEIYECLLQSPNPNSLGVKIDLSLAKKTWLGG